MLVLWVDDAYCFSCFLFLEEKQRRRKVKNSAVPKRYAQLMKKNNRQFLIEKVLIRAPVQSSKSDQTPLLFNCFAGAGGLRATFRSRNRDRTPIRVALVSDALISFILFTSLAIGFALPMALLFWLPNIRRLLPKPGSWMQTFRQFLVFPVLATVIWLLWAYQSQTGHVHHRLGRHIALRGGHRQH